MRSHILQNCGTNCDSIIRVVSTIASHLGDKFVGFTIDQHDTATIGFNPLKNQLHNPLQELIDIQRVTDRQGGAIHDLEVTSSPCQPGTSTRFKPGKKLTPFLLTHRSDNSRRGVAVPDDIHIVAGVGRLFVRRFGIDHQGATDLNPITTAKRLPINTDTVDKGAI